MPIWAKRPTCIYTNVRCNQKKKMKQLLSIKTILPILILILSIGCKKDELKMNHDLIADGCIPQKIVLDEPLLGGYEDNYIYENDRLIRYGNKTIEYEEGLVSRIKLGPNRYEEYSYNEEFQVIQSIQFRQDNPSEGFKVVDEKKYKYNENRIVEIIDIDDEETNIGRLPRCMQRAVRLCAAELRLDQD